MSLNDIIDRAESTFHLDHHKVELGKHLLEDAIGKPGETASQKAMHAVNYDMGTLAGVAELLPNGTLKGSDVASMVKVVTGKTPSGPAGDFLQSIDTITKNGNNIDIKRHGDSAIKIDKKVGPGTAVESLDLSKDMSFTLQNQAGGNVELAGLKGANVKVGTPLGDKELPINSVDISKDAVGHSVFTAKVATPEAGRILLGEKESIPVAVQFDDSGIPKVINEAQIKKEAVNPWSLGGIFSKTVHDASDLLHHPSLEGVGRLAEDSLRAQVAPIVDTWDAIWNNI